MSKLIDFIKTPKGLIIIAIILLVIVIIVSYNLDTIVGLFSSKPKTGTRIINPNPKVYLTDCVAGYETINGLQGSRKCHNNGDGTYSYV